MNYQIELVRDFDGTYYANASQLIFKDLPEYVPYRELSRAVKAKTGRGLPKVSTLNWEHLGRKSYAYCVI